MGKTMGKTWLAGWVAMMGSSGFGLSNQRPRKSMVLPACHSPLAYT